MAQILKQSTAVDVLIGPFVDKTDGATAETGESPTVKLSKNGQTLAAKNDITTPVHDADGYYNCELDATDTNTVGTLILTVAASANALPVRHEFQVLEEAIYDALIGASAAGFDANQRVDVGSWLGTAVTSGTNGPDVNVDAWNDVLLATTNPLPNAAADAAGGLPISDAGGLDMDSLATGEISAKYNGPRGPGVFLNTTASNTNTVLGTDGTVSNPVSTLAAAVTLVGSLGEKRIYVVGASTVSLAGQTLADYEFVGQSTFNSAILNLGTAASPSTLSRFRAENLTVYGTHDFTDRINLVNCIIDDAPAAEITKLNVIAICCALQGDFSLDTSTDNLFDCCYSAVAGNGYPVCNATGAAGTVVFRHYSGGIGFNSLSASHTLSVETDGQVVFESGCNVNAACSLRGMMTITDNTAGMSSLTTGAAFGPTIGTPAGASVSADIATVDSNVDAILVDTGTTLPATLGTPAGADLATDIAAVKTDTAAILVDTGTTLDGKIDTIDTIVDRLNLGIITGSAATGTLSTTQATSDLTGYADDQLIGRVIIWTSGNCDGEATDITDYASASGLLTFTALTTAPANGDTFKIV